MTSSLRTTLRNFVLRDSRNNGNFLVGQFGFCKHGIHHFKLYLFLSFMKFVFECHILVPYESVSLVKGHLVVDSFRFTGICVPGSKILHVSLDNRILEFLVFTKYIKIFEGSVSQSDVSVLSSPVFEMVNRESALKDVLGAQKNDVLILKICIKSALRKGNAIAHTLVVPGTLREFLGIDHLHFQIKGADRFSFLVGFPSKDVVTDPLMLGIVAQDRFWNRRFQVINFDVQQMFICKLLLNSGVQIYKDKSPIFEKSEFCKQLFARLFVLVLRFG